MLVSLSDCNNGIVVLSFGGIDVSCKLENIILVILGYMLVLNIFGIVCVLDLLIVRLLMFFNVWWELFVSVLFFCSKVEFFRIRRIWKFVVCFYWEMLLVEKL